MADIQRLKNSDNNANPYKVDDYIIAALDNPLIL